MAFDTLVEAGKLSNNKLEKGVIELLYKENPVLSRIPFMDITGNGWTYNVETTMSSANFYNVGDVWNESSPTVTQTTAVLKILGQDADVDKFLQKTMTDTNDLERLAIEAATKAVEWEFMDAFFYGSTSSNKGFNGLHSLISNTTYNTVHAGTDTGTALSIAKLREAIDMVKGTPSMIISSKLMRRTMTTYLDSVGAAFTGGRDDFGIPVKYFSEIPWYVCDFITDTETASSGAYAAKTGGGNTSIFILSFEPKGKALTGLQNGKITVEPVGTLQNKDANRFRIKWYCSLALPSIITCAKVDGIDADGTVTA